MKRPKMLTNYFRFVVVLLLAGSTLAQSADPSLMGFSDPAAQRQHDIEKRFDSVLNPADLRDWLKRLSARPHHLGSAYDKENAEFIAAQFKSWGYDTQIESFEVLFPTPKSRLVEMTAPERFTMKLQEPAVAEDPTTAQQTEQLPTYNAYS